MFFAFCKMPLEILKKNTFFYFTDNFSLCTIFLFFMFDVQNMNSLIYNMTYTVNAITSCK